MRISYLKQHYRLMYLNWNRAVYVSVNYPYIVVYNLNMCRMNAISIEEYGAGGIVL